MRWYLRPEERRPDPPPLATDDRRAIAVGTALWALALVAALLGHGALERAGHGWWPWAALAGVALGVVGLVHEQRRRDRRPS